MQDLLLIFLFYLVMAGITCGYGFLASRYERPPLMTYILVSMLLCFLVAPIFDVWYYGSLSLGFEYYAFGCIVDWLVAMGGLCVGLELET